VLIEAARPGNGNTASFAVPAVGGIAGINHGAISGNGVISGCTNSGQISGRFIVGGIVGINISNIGAYGYQATAGTRLTSLATVSGNTNTITGTVTNLTTVANANTATGGIVGYNLGGFIENCSNLSTVSGHTTVGGIVGVNWRPPVITSFGQGATINGAGWIWRSGNRGNITGNTDVGGVVGRNEGNVVSIISVVSQESQELAELQESITLQ
jgi:hypothetical protein